MLIALSISFFLMAVIALAELRSPASMVPSSRLQNLGAFGLHLGAQLLLLPVVALTPVVVGYSLVDLSTWPLLFGTVAFTLLMDFGEFSFHRAQHALPFLWRMHALHHSDPNMNVTTTVRHFWGDQLVKAVTIWPACALILKPTPAVMLCYVVISFYHFFVHANLRVSFGKLSWLLNSPAYHRRHHSAEEAHHNCNFASLFPFYDLLFGSYRKPDGFPETGLPKQPRNLVDVAVWPIRSI